VICDDAYFAPSSIFIFFMTLFIKALHTVQNIWRDNNVNIIWRADKGIKHWGNKVHRIRGVNNTTVDINPTG